MVKKLGKNMELGRIKICNWEGNEKGTLERIWNVMERYWKELGKELSKGQGKEPNKHFELISRLR